MSYIPTLRLDPAPFSRGGSVAIVTVSLLHVYQAVSWLLWPSTGGATCLRALAQFMCAFGFPYPTPIAIVIMATTAGLGLVGALFRLGWARLLLFIPQQMILGIMAAGGMLAAQRGAYLDGTVMPWQHIAADQMPMVVLLAVHTSAILRRCWDPNG